MYNAFIAYKRFGGPTTHDSVGSQTSVALPAYPCNPEVDTTLDISTNEKYLRVALTVAAATQLEQELTAIIDVVEYI